MNDAQTIRAVADEMMEAFDEHGPHIVMSALTLITAEALACCDMKEGKDINFALELFNKQVRAIYAALTTPELQS